MSHSNFHFIKIRPNFTQKVAELEFETQSRNGSAFNHMPKIRDENTLGARHVKRMFEVALALRLESQGS